MDRKLKHIMAREGLVLLGIVIFGLGLFFFGNYLNSRPVDIVELISRNRTLAGHKDFDGIKH